MKWVKYYIAAVTLLLLMVISSAAKQPPPDLGYEPPAGWEFVMKLDSASTFNLHCHNDTCFLASSFSSGRPLFYEITTDGGETWNKIPTMPLTSFMINSISVHGVMLEGSNFMYEKSSDFCKTSEKYFICKSPYPEDTLYQSPIDPNILIATFKYEELIDESYNICDMFAMISLDGGKTWEKMTNLYRHPENQTFYKFNFDWAEKGHWFVSAEDGKDIYGILKKVSPPVYLETFDDGKTFREIKFNPINEYIGIEGKNTMFHFIFDKYRYFDSIYKTYINYYTTKGIRTFIYSDTITNDERINWLNLIEPTKPMTNLDSGYIFTLNQYYLQTYQYDYENYSNQVINALEISGVDLLKKTVKGNHDFFARLRMVEKHGLY